MEISVGYEHFFFLVLRMEFTALHILRGLSTIELHSELDITILISNLSLQFLEIAQCPPKTHFSF